MFSLSPFQKFLLFKAFVIKRRHNDDDDDDENKNVNNDDDNDNDDNNDDNSHNKPQKRNLGTGFLLNSLSCGGGLNDVLKGCK